MRRIRILLATLSVLTLTAVLLDFTGTAAGLFGWFAKIQFMPAVLAGSAVALAVLTALTLLAGRVYCSTICPLGVLQDFVRWFTFGRRRDLRHAVPPRQGPVVRGVRLAVLALFAGGGLVGLHYAWLDPYAIYGRFAASLAPLVRMSNNRLADWAARNGSYCAATVEVAVPTAGFLLIALGTVAAIAALAAWRGRFWCNAVCPVGTLLGALSKFAWFKPRIDASKCVGCRLCEKTCRAHCIDVTDRSFDRTRCVSCFDCSAVCGKGAITWKR